MLIPPYLVGISFKKKDAYTTLFGRYKLQKKKDAYTILFGRYKLQKKKDAYTTLLVGKDYKLHSIISTLPFGDSLAVTSYFVKLTSFSETLTSFSEVLTSFSEMLTSFSERLTSFSETLTSFSETLTSFSLSSCRALCLASLGRHFFSVLPPSKNHKVTFALSQPKTSLLSLCLKSKISNISHSYEPLV